MPTTSKEAVTEGFVKQNWLIGTMGTLIFVLGGIVGHVFDSRLTAVETWKNETDVSRATRTAELRMETVRAMERLTALQKWVDRHEVDINHLHEDLERLQRMK